MGFGDPIPGKPGTVITASAPPDVERVVLCIEDDESLARLVVLILKRVEGVRVQIAGSRRDALRAIDATRCDVVVTDLNLPDAAGPAWVSELTGLAALRDVPVAVLSADRTPRSIEAATRAGAMCYLTKPVDRGQLIALVSNLGAASSDEVPVAPDADDERPPADLVDRCVTQTAVELGQLRQAITRGDADRVEWFRHRLVGRALMFGIADLAEVLARIDTTFPPGAVGVAERLVDRADAALERFRLDATS